MELSMWNGPCVAAVLTLLRRGAPPLVEPPAFRSRTVRIAIACQALLSVGMASYFLVLALHLQDGRGLGALSSGAVFTLVAVSRWATPPDRPHHRPALNDARSWRAG
jgi:hypothetical protein